MRLRFSNLPLLEAAVRLSLDPPIDIGVRTSNGIYPHVAERYPALEDASNFEPPPGIEASVFVNDLTSFVGFRSTNVNTGLSLTFQRRLLSSRWSINPLEPRYSGFESLLDGLELGLGGLLKAGVPAPVPIVANMVYVDFIAGDSSAIDRFLKLGAPMDAFAQSKTKQRLVVAWQEDSAIDLNVDLQAANLNLGEEPVPGYQISTSAGIRDFDPEKPTEALWRLHDRLQLLFLELMTDDAKTEWGLTIED